LYADFLEADVFMPVIVALGERDITYESAQLNVPNELCTNVVIHRINLNKVLLTQVIETRSSESVIAGPLVDSLNKWGIRFKGTSEKV